MTVRAVAERSAAVRQNPAYRPVATLPPFMHSRARAARPRPAVILLAIAGVAAAACVRRAPEAPSPEPLPPAGTPASGGVNAPAGVPGRAAAFTWAPAPVVRRLEVRTDVEVVRDDAGAAGESPERVRTVVRLADTVMAGAGPGSARAAGVVEALEVAASARVQGAAGAPPFAPFGYQAFSDARGVRADPAPGTGVDLRCTAPAGATALGALAAVRETLPRVPAGAAPGARWRDTTVSAACAGPVLLVVQTASRYEAQAGEGGALAVVRRSSSTFRGQGAAGVRPVAVAGAGTGEARYLMDAARGTVASGSGETRTTLTVTVAGAAQRFTQRARTQVAEAR